MSNNYKKSSDVPTEILAHRLYYLASLIAKPGAVETSEFTMRIPAEVDRDADLVLAEASRRLAELEQRLAAAESKINERDIWIDENAVELSVQEHRIAELEAQIPRWIPLTEKQPELEDDNQVGGL